MFYQVKKLNNQIVAKSLIDNLGPEIPEWSVIKESVIDFEIGEVFEETDEKLKTSIKPERKALIEKHKWLIERHISQLEQVRLGQRSSTGLTEAQYIEALNYIQELRDLPQRIENGEMTLETFAWPVLPGFMAH